MALDANDLNGTPLLDTRGNTENKVLYTSSQFNIKSKGSAPDPASGQSSIPSEIQPYLNTPGIVLPPPAKPDDVTNTTVSPDSRNQPLPRLDASAASFGTFQPVQHEKNAATAAAAAAVKGMCGDLMFLVVVAAFTALVVTS